MKISKVACFALFSLLTLQGYTQDLTAKLVDSKTGQGIPYATIRFDTNSGIITNEEGLFSLRWSAIPENQDSLYISCMGYEKLAISIQRISDSIIKISPKAIDLDEVFLFDREMEVEDIIEQVIERLPYNYNKQPVKQRMFFRQSSLNNLNKFEIDFKKSTIAELNEKFLDSVTGLIPRSSAYYTESLCDFYRTPEEHKLYIEKAAELYDKNNEGSMDALSEKMERIFRENVKPNSYLKIKSGIFGTKMELDSVFDAEDEEAKESEPVVEKEEKHYFLSNRKSAIHNIYASLFFNDESKLNFLEKPNRYNFSLKGYTSIDDAGVYIISFAPKRSEDFQGTIYVNIDDYAVVRLEYENVKSLRRIRLLGLSYEEQLYRGTTLFARGSNGKYELRFLEKIIGNQMGVRRPLKVIEKNKYVKGRRKQNELSMELDISNYNREKYELVVFQNNLISNEEFQGTVENESIKATYLSRYDPEFWKGYDIMEPNEAIRSFSASTEKNP
ncbi:carboxypeptidase-like regulatory domain-containing protein [Lentiprolixibacter aurantiacus]|uniref:Carboxypeptidase-like regulatory domain-containing protein n=1 Tax=Lentiprolixibacter aurantiacus TaxID=2993939 RepID=A0AAE3MPL7_9FLAO|nr:carboxypeptidase-like regulatory domain-containing protein [Lentiprolixibacter aurantiacus]MCX2720652.1 carboxypeptidase-like regulatory domain-containing protein [Lentiprolixibacter aurantiacus]